VTGRQGEKDDWISWAAVLLRNWFPGRFRKEPEKEIEGTSGTKGKKKKGSENKEPSYLFLGSIGEGWGTNESLQKREEKKRDRRAKLKNCVSTLEVPNSISPKSYALQKKKGA